jgi:uroporphyrinogen decarboxylase
MQMVSSVDLSTEITVEPVDYLGVDAAIVFHDILIPFELLGLELDFIEGVGPVLAPPIRTASDVARLGAFACDDELVVVQTLKSVREKLGEQTAVLGFAGAPLTLATYAVEGRSDKKRPHFQAMLRDDPDTLIEIMNILAPVIAAYLAQQARHADAVQLFESHADLLPREDYERLALPALRETIRIFRELDPDTPLLLFAQGMRNIAPCVRDLDVDGFSIDQHLSLSEAVERLCPGARRPVLQGNFDPQQLCATANGVVQDAESFLRAGSEALGHPPGDGLPTGWIVNLGHGITPKTAPASARAFVETVHAFSNQ